MRRWLPAALVVVSVGLAACSGEEEPTATRNESGAVATEGAVDAFDIALGDCIDDPTGGPGEVSTVESVRAVPCDQPHDGEVYHLFDLPDGPFPGDEAVDTAVQEGCAGTFQAFVGMSYEDSALDYISLQPTEQTWNEADDREVVCIVADPSGGKVTGSLRGVAR